MKKLLMNAAIATGFALFAGNAFAVDVNDFPSSIGFEGNDQGMLNLWGDDGRGDEATYWNTSGDVESTFVTNYTDTGVAEPTSRPDLFAGDESNNNFLKIDSPNGIERYMQLGGVAQSLDSDVFVDMNVQFTVSDAVLELGENPDNDKLAIWLYAPEEGAETNLVITAATVDEDGKPTAQNFVATLENEIEPEKWYRLTVKASGSVGLKGPYFNVYIDGEKVSSSKTVDGETFATPVADFYSLVRFLGDDNTTKTLSSVTFQGVGALDDLAFTTTKPGFIPAEVKPFAIGETGYDTFADAAEEAVGSVVITMQANYDVVNEESGAITVDGNVTLDLGTFTLSNSVAGSDTLDIVGSLTLLGTGSVTGYGYDEEAEDTYYPIFIEKMVL